MDWNLGGFGLTLQAILQDAAGDHGIFLAYPHGGVVGEQSGFRPGVICYNMFCYIVWTRL
jgi:hypothetical protein